MKHPCLLAFTLALGLWPCAALGADVLTLPAAIERATARHPSLRVAAAELDVARAKEAQALANPNPSVLLQAAEMPVANPANGNLMAGVSLALPAGGAQAARAEIARLEGLAATTELQAQRRDVVAEVKSAYAQVGHHTARVRLAREALDDAERLVTAAQTRYDAGDVARGEVFRAEVERNRARRELLVAEGLLSLANRRLGLLIGQDPDEEVTLADLPAPSGRQFPPIADLRARTTTWRPELRRAELDIQVAEQQRASAQASVWQGTEVSLSGGLAEQQPAVSTTLTLPLPLYANQGEIAEAEARKRQAEARLEALRLRLEIELQETYQATVIALTRYHLVTEVDLPQARVFAENARRRFMAGEGSGVETVEALRTLRGVEGEQLSALLEYHEALARLEKTVGTDLAP